MKFLWQLIGFCILLFGFNIDEANAGSDDEDELVIQLLVDALRPDHISGLGYDKPTTASFLTGYKGKLRRTPSWEYNNDYPQAERDAVVALYDASIRYTDDVLEGFRTYLEGLSIKDKTTLFLTADHGDGMGEHGFYLHAHQF